MKNFKQRWNISSNRQFFIIILVFAITGSCSALLAKPLLMLFKMDKQTSNLFLFWICYVVILFPIYQILLLSFGFLFKQFHFFWQFELKMLRSLKLGFLADFLNKKKGT